LFHLPNENYEILTSIVIITRHNRKSGILGGIRLSANVCPILFDYIHFKIGRFEGIVYYFQIITKTSSGDVIWNH